MTRNPCIALLSSYTMVSTEERGRGFLELVKKCTIQSLSCQAPLLRENSTSMNSHETSMSRAFELCTLQQDLQLDHNIVIALSSKHPTIRETKDPLSFPEFPFTPKQYS